MRSFPLLFLPITFCILFLVVGCENKRYQPAEWSSTTLPGEVKKSNKVASGAASEELERPTDWMTMVGKGGESVERRGTSLPKAAHRGGTMPVRRGGTSLPARGIGTSLPARGAAGTTLPARQSPSHSGTTMPARKGTTLPRR